MKKQTTIGKPLSGLTCIEICSGAGGQAIGLERAGFEALAHVQYDRHACANLCINRPNWNVVEGDVRNFSAKEFKGVDLVAGGVPCPPFSKAGKQLGSEDERDLFPEALRLVDECRPKAVMLENVRGFLDAVFTDYRMGLKKELKAMGYEASWHLLNASDFRIPQLRPRRRGQSRLTSIDRPRTPWREQKSKENGFLPWIFEFSTHSPCKHSKIDAPHKNCSKELMNTSLPTFVDFFPGSGLVTQGAKHACTPVWPNDICPKKATIYTANHSPWQFPQDLRLGRRYCSQILII